jgi:integrase
MPKTSANVLATDREIQTVPTVGRTDYRIRGAPGLQLRVTGSGTKTWAFAYKSPATGKWAKVALGRYPSVGLAEAKGLAVDVAAGVRKGKDPIHDKPRSVQHGTFKDLARLYMQEHERRNARGDRISTSTAEAQRQLDKDILPALGGLRSDAVSRQHVMEVVEAVAARHAYVAADRALGLIRAIFNWACGTGRTENNPTIGLKKRNTGRPRARVLSDAEIRIFWRSLETIASVTPPIRDALRLELVTGARIGEVLSAPRSEVDLAAGLWTIAAHRTKAGREHALPLSSLAVSIFNAAIQRADRELRVRAERKGRPYEASPWIFPSRTTAGHILPHAASLVLVRCRQEFVSAGIEESFNSHDLRRTLATRLGEMGTPDEIIERILNHAPRTVAGRHYVHGRYLGPMKEAVEAWAKRLQVITNTDCGG